MAWKRARRLHAVISRSRKSCGEHAAGPNHYSDCVLQANVFEHLSSLGRLTANRGPSNRKQRGLGPPLAPARVEVCRLNAVALTGLFQGSMSNCQGMMVTEDPRGSYPWALRESVDSWPMANIILRRLGVNRNP